MRMFSRVTLLSLVVVVSLLGSVYAQDPAKVGPTIYKCTFENDRVRLCEIRFRPGDSIAMHSHPRHLVYVTNSGTLRITSATGVAQDAEFKAGTSVWSEADSHSAVNIGKSDVRGLVIELKERPPMTAEQTLKAMESDWAAAMMRGDTAALEPILAANWAMVGAQGERTNRAEAMAALRSGDLKFESMAPSELDVQIIGDTAIVVGRSKDKGTYKGQDISGDYRFTDVFVHRDGRWQAVSTHVTRVAPPM